MLDSPGKAIDSLWVRWGFPESLLSGSKDQSVRWREDFIRTYLERDIPQFGPRIPAEMLRRFWTMFAHRQGAPANAAELAKSLGLDSRTTSGNVDLMIDLLLVRRLPAWHANVGKRLAKSPRLYIRDSGLVHALLGVTDKGSLAGHPIAGQSWERFVIENLLASCCGRVQGYYYRTSGDAEIDLLIVWPDGRRWAIEIKCSLSPSPQRGFYEARQDIRPDRSFVVYPGEERYAVTEGVVATPLLKLAEELRETQ